MVPKKTWLMDFPPLPAVNKVDDWAREDELSELISSPIINFKQWATAFMILLDKVVPDESSYDDDRKLKTLKVFCEGHNIQLDFKDGLTIHVSGYEPDIPEEEEEDDKEEEPVQDEWITPKTRKQSRIERQSQVQPLWYLFADDMRNPHMSFVSTYTSEDEAHEALEKQYMGHVYCPDTKTIFDKMLTPFKACTPSKVVKAFCSKFYLNKFDKWKSWYEKADLETLKSVFKVYTQASTWKEDVIYLGEVSTLDEAREKIKTHYQTEGLPWYHVYCPDTNIIYDYKFSDQRFCQKMKTKDSLK